MENLNDLIWTDENSNEKDKINPQGDNMHQICMTAFCGNNFSGTPYGSCTVCGGDLRLFSCLP